MKLQEVKKYNTAYLYEGLDNNQSKTMKLWESVGIKLAEAQLTPDQITQIFQQIEQGATAAGSNRTAIGKGKDVASAVAQAYATLKGKVANSATMQMFDQQYDQVAEKLKQATGGDQGVMTYVQKYRDFAKKHPMAQSLIYSALIAAAGISGAGAGGAAALGLLKMTDKLLQGEKFSQAAISGAETGALAYGASKVGDMIRGADQTTNIPTDDTTEFSTEYEGYNIANTPVIPGQPLTQDQMTVMKMSMDMGNTYPPEIMDMYNSQVTAPGGITLPAADAAMDQSTQLQVAQEYATADPATKAEIIKNTGMTDAALKALAAQSAQSNFESRLLTNTEINSLFEHIIIEAGLWDKFKQGAGAAVTQVVGATPGQIAGAAKGAAGAVGQKLAQVGQNITTKVTADKLQSAWQKAGSPTDSEAIADILTAQGIDPTIVNSAFQSASIKRVDRTKLPNISTLTPQQKQQLLAQLDALDQGATAAPTATATKTHTGGKVAGQVSQTPNAIRQRQARATKTAAPAQQLPGDRTTPMSQLIKQRQAQGLAESYQDFRKKLNKELKR